MSWRWLGAWAHPTSPMTMWVVVVEALTYLTYTAKQMQLEKHKYKMVAWNYYSFSEHKIKNALLIRDMWLHWITGLLSPGGITLCLAELLGVGNPPAMHLATFRLDITLHEYKASLDSLLLTLFGNYYHTFFLSSYFFSLVVWINKVLGKRLNVNQEWGVNSASQCWRKYQSL